MKVSVITVCLNSQKTIENTIKSVVTQDYKNYEYIVVDGKSSDQTIEIVKKYKKYISRLIIEKDKGIYDAINKGIEKTSGKIICILHSNDSFFDKKVLSEVVSQFRKNNLGILLGDTIIHKKNCPNKTFRYYSSSYFRPWMLYFGFSPPHPSTFVSKSTYASYGLYNNKYKIAGDFEFFVRTMLKYRVCYKTIKKVLVKMSPGGTSNKNFKSYFVSTNELVNSLKINGFFSSYFLTLFRIPIKILQLILK